MGRRLTFAEQVSGEWDRREDAIIFDLIYWWQQQYPSATLHELVDWWEQNRSTRTQEEFSRLLRQILKRQPGGGWSASFDDQPINISGELQQRIEQGVLRCISYL